MQNIKDGVSAKIFSVKEAKTFVEQVALIKNKGFAVDDEEECAAFLNQASYHRLSEYFLPFLGADGRCTQKINFRRIQRIYEFDGKMRVALLRCIGEIELYLRTQFAYFSGHKHGALGYRDVSAFSNRSAHEKFLKHVDEIIEKNRRTSVVQYYMEKCGGNFPIWVVIELVSMGMLSNFYRGLKTEDQKILAKKMYRTSPTCLTTWLRCVINLRNRCAHYSKLYYWSFPALPRTPQKAIFAVDHKLFTQIMTLKFLYPEPEKWNSELFVEIENLMTEYANDVSLKHIGFPENWKEFLRKSAVQ